MKVRIIEKTYYNRQKSYIIQKKFLFWWINAEMSYESRKVLGDFKLNVFSTFEEAQKYLWCFDGTKSKMKVFYAN